MKMSARRRNAGLWAASCLSISGLLGFACEQAQPGKTSFPASAQAALNTSSQKGLPKLGTLKAFALLDQAGKSFTAETLRGKVWVAAFMFTRCPTICPLMTKRMKALQQEARAESIPLHLVSFSVDPENDTPSVLSVYVADNAIDTKSWSFVTGDSAVIREAAEHGFKIGVEGKADPNAEGFGITHGSHFVLVDANLTLRGYYQSSDPDRVKQLLVDAKSLKGS